MKYQNRLTTGIGFLIIISCLGMLVMGKIDMPMAVLGIGCGGGFIVSKDHDK